MSKNKYLISIERWNGDPGGHFNSTKKASDENLKEVLKDILEDEYKYKKYDNFNTLDEFLDCVIGDGGYLWENWGYDQKLEVNIEEF